MHCCLKAMEFLCNAKKRMKRIKFGLNFIFAWTGVDNKPFFELVLSETHTVSYRSCILGWRWTWRRIWWPCLQPPGSLSLWRSSYEPWWQTYPPLCKHCGSQHLLRNTHCFQSNTEWTSTIWQGNFCKLHYWHMQTITMHCSKVELWST